MPTALEVKDLSKIYRLYRSPRDRLRELLSLNSRKHHQDFRALDGVSFSVEQGETFGIIGQNGSGKSTLLKILSGVTRPTSGSVRVNGRVSSLLELGAGFHPEFTGRDNIYFNGAINGYHQDVINGRFESIRNFAGIGDFIDQPVKMYSSGMYMKLAFATAINMDPNILIIDEAFSVGDMTFQHRCVSKLMEFRERHKTILLVTHDLSFVKSICNKAILLVDGKVALHGSPEAVTEHYVRLTREKPDPGIVQEMIPGREVGITCAEYEPSEYEAQITDVAILSSQLVRVPVFRYRETVIIRVACVIGMSVKNPSIAIQIRDLRGYVIYGTHTAMQGVRLRIAQPDRTARVSFAVPGRLGVGSYSVTVALDDYISETEIRTLDKKVSAGVFRVVGGKASFMGVVNLDVEIYQSEG